MSEIIRIAKSTTQVAVSRQSLDAPRLSLATKEHGHTWKPIPNWTLKPRPWPGPGHVTEIKRCLDELIQAGYLEVR